MARLVASLDRKELIRPSNEDLPVGRKVCPFQDYLPCECEQLGTYNYVTCVYIPSDEIQSLFATANENITRLTLKLDYSYIPDSLIANKRIEYIVLDCEDRPLNVSVDAFRSSENHTVEVLFIDCDLTTTHLHFLTNFTMLDYFGVVGGVLESFPSMPLLPNMQYMHLQNFSGLTQWYEPSLTPVLQYICILNLETEGDVAIERIMQVIPYYADTLRTLILDSVGLTRIPPQIKSLKRLEWLDLNNDTISVLPNAALALDVKLQFLSLDYMRIDTIEPGALQGTIT